MTQEEKAKAYDEALERAKKYNIDDAYASQGTIIKSIFPELAESEDERIIKTLQEYVKNRNWPLNGPTQAEVLDWLEKQKEPKWNKKPCLTCQEYENGFKQGRLEGFTAGYNKAMKEVKQKEQKPNFDTHWENGSMVCEQKEPHYTKRNALFDKCVENCDPKTVEEVNKRVDDIINMSELSAFEQALTNFIGYWEDDEEHWPSQFVKKHGKHVLDMAREELEKEQKPLRNLEIPAENESVVETADSELEKELNAFLCGYDREINEEEITTLTNVAEHFYQLGEKEHRSVSYSPLCNTIKDKIREYVANNFVTDTIVKTDVKSIVKAMEEGVRLGKEEQKPLKVGENAYFDPNTEMWFIKKEPKPAEWSEKFIADVFEKVGLAKIVREQGNDALTNAVQPAMIELSKVGNTEWSEEDEKRMDSIINILCCYKANLPTKNQLFNVSFQGEVVDADIAWLKSLRPQPKQEWSEDFDKEVENVHKRYPEVSFAKLTRIAYHFSKWANRHNDTEWSKEDEKIAKEIEEALWYPGDFPDYPSKEESELYDDCQRRLNWFKNKLKSLRPQYNGDVTMTEAYKMGKEAGEASHWKPSEDDIMMLTHIIGQYETGNKNSKVMGYLPKIEELNFLKKVLAKWKNLL